MIQKSLLIDTALACCFWTHCFHFILVHFKVWTNFFLSLFCKLFHVEPKLKLARFLDVYIRYMYACVCVCTLYVCMCALYIYTCIHASVCALCVYIHFSECSAFSRQISAGSALSPRETEAEFCLWNLCLSFPPPSLVELSPIATSTCFS